MVEWTTADAVSRSSTWLQTLAPPAVLDAVNQPVRIRQDLCRPFDGPVTA
jgi:hypothetical protein